MADLISNSQALVSSVVESEERLRLATEAANMFAWELDLTENKIIWAANSARVIGCSPDELSADPSRANFFAHPDDRGPMMAEFNRALENGEENFAFAFRGVSVDQDRAFWNVRGKFIRDAAQVATRVIAATQNITEQKLAQDALRLGVERLETAEEAAGAVVYDIDLKNDEVWRSKSTSRILGWSAEEIGLRQVDWENLRHPDDAERLKNLDIKDYLQPNDSYILEYRIRHRDGHYVWLLDSGKVFRNVAGDIVRMAGASIDISQRKKIEASNSRLANLIDLSFEPIFVWHPQKGIVEWNRGAENLYGFSKAEAIGRSSHRLLKTRAELSESELLQILQVGRSWTGELEHLSKDGRQIFVETRQQAIDSEGEWLVMETDHDITLRRLTEAFNARMASVALASHDALFGLSVDGIIETWNPACSRLFGYSAEEAIGQHVSMLAEPSQRTEQMQFKEMAKGDHPVGPYEARRLRKDGSYVYISVTLAPVKSLDGRTIGISVAMHDVTERREWEARQRLMNLELAHRSKNTFAVLQGILRSTLRTAENPQAFATAFEGRLHSLAMAQDVLSASDWKGAELGALARLQFATYLRDNDNRIDISGPAVNLSAEYAAPFGLIFNELASNALKYGALSVPTGNVQLYWRTERHLDSKITIFLTWRERGGPPPSKNISPKFGAMLIEKSLAGAKVKNTFEEQGFTCNIEITLKKVRKLRLSRKSSKVILAKLV